MTGLLSSKREQAAAMALDRGIVSLASRGGRLRCGDPDDHRLWVSEEYLDRKRAALLCCDCPVLRLCGLWADSFHASFGVFGGVDRTTRAAGKIAA
jgi:Transcription factor WhiB